ncbi:phosphatase PAP2 family protein [Arthrobacter sp. HLT1-20]
MQESLSNPSNPPSRRRHYQLAAALVLGGGLLFALALLAVLGRTGIAAWDQPVHSWFVAQRSPGATSIWEIITTLSSPTYMTILGIVVTALWAAVRRELWRPALLLAAMAFTAMFSFVVKHLVGRPRPPEADFMMGPDGTYSFPSGHTFGSAVFILVLAYLLLSRHSTTALRAAAVIAAAVLIPAVAISRLYLGYHWLSDVMASMALAVVVLGLVMAVDTWQPLQKYSIAARRPKAVPEPARQLSQPSP